VTDRFSEVTAATAVEDHTAVSRPMKLAAGPAPLPELRTMSHRARAKLESTLVFVTAFAVNLAAARYLVDNLHFVSVDGLAGVANAFFVLFSRDPHLAAIGLVLSPLPSFLELPIVALKGWAPWLVTGAFAASIETAAFGAGGAVIVGLLVRDAGLRLPLRLAMVAAWIANPMLIFYSANGMSDIELMFFILLEGLLLLRWLRAPRDSLLVALGAVVATSTLVRYEAWAFSVLILVPLVVAQRRWSTPWRQIEARVLLYGLPVAFAILFWIGANAVIMHDPFDFLTNVYGNLSQTRAIGSRPEGWLGAATSVFNEVLQLYPAYLCCLAVSLWMAMRRRQLRLGFSLVLLTTAALLIMGYLAHKGSLDYLLRYFMSAIAGSFVLAGYSLGLVRGGRAKVVVGSLLAMAMAGSCVASFEAMNNLTLGGPGMEHAVVTAALSGQPVTNDSFAGRTQQEIGLGRAIDRLDPDRRLILVDSFLGFPIVVSSPDPRLFVVTSDKDFEAALNDPAAYHVGYFLVPTPSAEGSLDAINRRYPNFWRTGDGFARLKAQLSHGSTSYEWRLYRISGRAPQ